VDTIPAVLTDIAVGDLDGNGSQEVAAPSIGLPPDNFFVFVDTTLGNIPLGSRHVYAFPTSNLTAASSIIMGDFDGDMDRDLIATGISDDFCVFLRNQGNLHFTSDTINTTSARGLAALDYENDGDLDFATINSTLDSLGVTVFLNNGTGHFTEKRNCYFPFASGTPNGIVAADFDLDGKTDIAVVSRSLGGRDSLFVLYNLGGFNGTTRVKEPAGHEIPQQVTLFQNYPNPFNPSTRIQYSLQSQSHVTIKIYNVLGQEITILVDERQLEGTHVVEWNGKSSAGMQVSSGVYFYRVEARQPDGQFLFASVKKMVLMK
jgi:FG-GAP-like repeat/FlgD Ig-like domain